MELLRIGPVGGEHPVVADNGVYFSLMPVLNGGDIDGTFLAQDGIAKVRDALHSGMLDEIDIEGKRLGAPIARPQAVICIGQNYAAHAAESGSAPPTTPIMFFKHPNTVIGPNDDVRIPRCSTNTDWEVELAVIIGKRCRYLESPQSAPSMIAGYTIANDVSERQFQLHDSGGQWSKGKSAETFNPLGPTLVPAENIPDPQNLGLRSFVNGNTRQNSNTKDMIFSVCDLIYNLSQ